MYGELAWLYDKLYASKDYAAEADIVKRAITAHIHSSGRLSTFDLHFLIGTCAGTEHFVEHHEMGLFETEEQMAILRGLGLEVTYDAKGLTGRGLFIAVKPLA